MILACIVTFMVKYLHEIAICTYISILKNDYMKVYHKVNIDIRTITDIIFYLEIFSIFKLFFN